MDDKLRCFFYKLQINKEGMHGKIVIMGVGEKEIKHFYAKRSFISS